MQNYSKIINTPFITPQPIKVDSTKVSEKKESAYIDEYLNIKGQLTNKEKSKIKNMLEENIKDIDEDNLVQVPFCWWPHWGSK